MGNFWNKLFGGGKKSVEAQQTPAAISLQEKMEQMNLAAHGVPSDTAVELIGEKGVLASIVILLSYIRYYVNSNSKGEITVKIGYNKPPSMPFVFSVNDSIVDDIYPGQTLDIN